jgi:hypothetical protein
VTGSSGKLCKEGASKEGNGNRRKLRSRFIVDRLKMSGQGLSLLDARALFRSPLCALLENIINVLIQIVSLARNLR